MTSTEERPDGLKQRLPVLEGYVEGGSRAAEPPGLADSLAPVLAQAGQRLLGRMRGPDAEVLGRYAYQAPASVFAHNSFPSLGAARVLARYKMRPLGP